jgi:hypothetical protein
MLNQDEGESNSMSSISALALSFGFGSNGGSSANLQDEIIRLTSQTILTETVHDQRLNYLSWTSKHFFSRKKWYYQDEPFRIDIPNQVLDTISVLTIFNFDVQKDGVINLKVKQDKDVVIDTKIKQLPYTAKTPYGRFVISSTPYYKPGQELDFHTMVMGTPDVIDGIRTDIKVEEIDKKANGIRVELECVSVPKGIATTNSLVDIYNEDRMTERHQSRQESLDFVENRLLLLYNELEKSENEIEDFKRDNKIVDAAAEAEYIFKRKGSIESVEVETRTQLEIYQMIYDMLSSPATRYSLLPVNNGASAERDGFAASILSYNELILKRMELQSSVKGQSAALDRLTEQIDALRENILTTLARQIQATKISIAAVDKEQGSSDSRMYEIPYIEKRLTQLYRDREVKNTIYAFLLQKREEAEIAVSQVKPISEVVDKAYADITPVSPNKLVVILVGIVFGLLIPCVLVKIFGKDPEQESADTEASQN